MIKEQKEKKLPGAGMSFMVFGAAIAVLLAGVVILDYDIHIVLLCALAVVCMASAALGYSFPDLVDCMKKSLGQALAAMIIFLYYYQLADIFRDSAGADLLRTAVYHSQLFSAYRPAPLQPYFNFHRYIMGDGRHHGAGYDGNWGRNGDSGPADSWNGDFRGIFRR